MTRVILKELRFIDSIEERIITIDSILSKDLGADSLDTVEIIQAIEKEFDIEIPDDFTGTNWISCICGSITHD